MTALAAALAAFWRWANEHPGEPAVPDVEDTISYALPLRYLIANEEQLEGRDDEITEVGYNGPPPKKGIGVRYANLYDQTGTGKYGPYLPASDTAGQYNEKVVDPKGDGWQRLLSDQCHSAIAAGFDTIEWDNPDGYSADAVIGAVDYAASLGLKVLAKNPLSCKWEPTAYLAHKAVVGVIVERGAGSPADMDALRQKAGKRDLPVWFVAFTDGHAWADSTAKLASAYKNMWVSYSPDGEYTSSQDVLMASQPAPLPPILDPQVQASQSLAFDQCVKLLLVHEGGNDDDPRDPGGRTSRGITAGDWSEWLKTHPGLPSDVWQAPQDQVLEIYRQRYWLPMRCDELPRGVDYAVFDYGVNSGIGRSVKELQLAVGVGVDGQFGPLTLAAVKAKEPKALIIKISNDRIAFLQGLRTWATFGHGWLTRVMEVRTDALAMVMPGPPLPLDPPKSVPPLNSAELHDLGHRIKRTMLTLTYPWFGDQNVVSVEGMNPDGTNNGNRPNAFDDIKMVLDGDGKIIGGPWEGTTQPGKYWTDHPMASGGAFIIALGPQACWTPGDYHDHTVWRQAENSTIMGTRDPNKTYKRIGVPFKHGNIGVHHHGGYNLPRDNISNAAAGCQVIRLVDRQHEFMNITMKCPRYLADKKNYRLTATVLQAKDVLP